MPGQTEGWTEGRMGRPYFIGPFWLPPEIQKAQRMKHPLVYNGYSQLSPTCLTFHIFGEYTGGGENFQIVRRK